MAGQADSLKTIFFALGANFGIFVAKLFAAFSTGSSAMFAEAVHSLADCGNQCLLLLGMKRATRQPTPDYPLGYGKEIYFWSFLVALMLFSVGGAYSLYEGIHKLMHPTQLTRPWLAIGVLVFGIVLESISMRTCLTEVNKVREGRSLWRWFRESRSSELIVIFGEDLAALFGLFFALSAIGLTMATGNPIYDAAGTVVIGALLIVVALFVAIEVKALLIGQSMLPARRAEIGAFLESQPDIRKVLNVITLHLGADVMVAVKVEMDPDLRTGDLVQRINAIEASMKRAFPDVRWSFFEPDDAY